MQSRVTLSLSPLLGLLMLVSDDRLSLTNRNHRKMITSHMKLMSILSPNNMALFSSCRGNVHL